ncbi:MAG TPA: iron uptake system protein EfeO [Aeromicrobium sp.]|jgi:iron uptake system component EfeO|nr:iron uptake system protein EfeO [Aeromicrobium sp.]HKY57123.1 iron uptake system protein EfeO [Aeromicrobium sp.]
MRNPVTLALAAIGLSLSLSACGTPTESAPEATGSAPKPLTATEKTQVAKATAEYTKYVQDELAGLVDGTTEFVTALKAGDDDRARTIYPNARTRWERVETIAAEFGDLDPAIDAREAGLGEGEEWTGWHRLEKDLWPARAKNYTPMTDAEQAEIADKLLADTKTIQRQGEDLKITVTDIVEGSQGLLEEIAGGKVTGEEEYWSRTDLWDFQANLDGAWKGFDLLKPVIEGRDAALAAKIDYQFGVVQGLLDATKRGDEFVTYDKLTRQQIKALSDAVNALGESLAEVSEVL